jgi:tetratricopeptide (TPR) repeat protein
MLRKNGPNHLDVAGVLSDLGVIRLREGRHREAQDFLQRALSIQEQNLGLKHPYIAITLNNLATCALNQGEPAKTASLLVRALAIQRAALGEESSEVATTLLHLANAHYKLAYFSESEREGRQALRIAEAGRTGDAALLPTLELLGAISMARGKRRQAKEYYCRIMVTAEQAYGPRDSRVTDLKSRHGHMLDHQKSGCPKVPTAQ